jgi:hypothetical protein
MLAGNRPGISMCVLHKTSLSYNGTERQTCLFHDRRISETCARLNASCLEEPDVSIAVIMIHGTIVTVKRLVVVLQ